MMNVKCFLFLYLELVVGIVAVGIQPPVVGDDAGGVDSEVVVGDGVGNVRVAARVRVRGLHFQDGRPNRNVLVDVVRLNYSIFFQLLNSNEITNYRYRYLELMYRYHEIRI